MTCNEYNIPYNILDYAEYKEFIVAFNVDSVAEMF